MEYTGHIGGLEHQPGSPLRYTLKIGQEGIDLNPLLGRPIAIHYLQEIACQHCGRIIKKSFNNGSCYPCFTRLPQNDLCYVKPELCHYEAGTCRDAAFGDAYCNQPHVVYLAQSSDVKVGITRQGHTQRRWGDQGAERAIVLAVTPTRRKAGEMEGAIARFLRDKTNRRKMLKGDGEPADLFAVRRKVEARLPEEFRAFLTEEGEEFTLEYPRVGEPKIQSLDLTKTPLFEGVLVGVKGQYLLFDKGVLNMKKHTGFKIRWAD